MSGKLDQISGNVKEKAGELLDDPKLQAEGVIQQGIGKVKEVAADIEITKIGRASCRERV